MEASTATSVIFGLNNGRKVINKTKFGGVQFRQNNDLFYHSQSDKRLLELLYLVVASDDKFVGYFKDLVGRFFHPKIDQKYLSDENIFRNDVLQEDVSVET